MVLSLRWIRVLILDLGEIDTVDRIVIEWPDGNGECSLDVPTNQTLVLDQKNGVPFNTIKIYQPEIINIDPVFTASLKMSLTSFTKKMSLSILTGII